jgi:hypothetical protein
MLSMNLQKIVAKLNTQSDSVSLSNKQPKEVKLLSPTIVALELKLDVASGRFNKAVRAINNEIKSVQQASLDSSALYDRDKQRYSWMPFLVKSSYNSPAFPKTADARHWWNTVKIGSELHTKVIQVWRKFRAMEVVRNELARAKLQETKRVSTIGAKKLVLDKVRAKRLNSKLHKASEGSNQDSDQPVELVRLERSKSNPKQITERVIKVKDERTVAREKERRATIAQLSQAFGINSAPTPLPVPGRRTKPLLKTQQQIRRKFKLWPRLVNQLRRMNVKRRRDKDKKTYLPVSAVMSWANFRPFLGRFNPVRFVLFQGALKKRTWPKPNVFRFARSDFVRLASSGRRVNAISANIVISKPALVPMPAINNPWKFDDKKLKAKVLISGFKYLPKAHDRVEQLGVGLSQHLFKNLISDVPTPIISDSNAVSSPVRNRDQQIKSERNLVVGYSKFMKKFYEDKSKRKVAKTLPAQRGIKHAVEFIQQTGTRKGNRLLKDFNSQVLRENVKYKREGLFYRERKNLFKLQILLDRFFGWLYDQDDVRGWMHELRDMDTKNYVMRNALIYRKNLKVAVDLGKTNVNQRSTLLIRRAV